VIDAAESYADEIGSTPGGDAIAWVRCQGHFPVIGPRTHAQLENNLAAAGMYTERTTHIRPSGQRHRSSAWIYR